MLMTPDPFSLLKSMTISTHVFDTHRLMSTIKLLFARIKKPSITEIFIKTKINRRLLYIRQLRRRKVLVEIDFIRK
jgi:hypothetical protein